MPDTKSSFEEEAGFPGNIGVVDETHVRIRAPEHEPEAYISRKKVYSINIQLVRDDNMVFIHVHAGWPGSVHDSRVMLRYGEQLHINFSVILISWGMEGIHC